jgi:hypothetical protein
MAEPPPQLQMGSALATLRKINRFEDHAQPEACGSI